MTNGIWRNRQPKKCCPLFPGFFCNPSMRYIVIKIDDISQGKFPLVERSKKSCLVHFLSRQKILRATSIGKAGHPPGWDRAVQALKEDPDPVSVVLVTAGGNIKEDPDPVLAARVTAGDTT